MINRKTLSELKKWLKEVDWRPVDLARAADVPQTTLSLILSANRGVGMETAAKLETVTGISASSWAVRA